MDDLKDLAEELMTLNDEHLAQRVIDDSDVQWCLSELYDILSADVAPVVHGHWVYKHRHRGGINQYTGPDSMGELHTISLDERYETDDPYCSRCGKLNEASSLSFCPNCGAKMDETDE